MRRCIVVLGILLLAGCQDQGPRFQGAPLHNQVGIQSANPFFFWQSPVPPGSVTGTGDFYATLKPVVAICQQTASGCDAIAWSADGAAPAASAIATVNLADELYQVNWENAKSHPRGTYTISVRVDAKPLGAVTVTLSESGSGDLNFSGNTVPIKFRIEVGALCYEEVGCGEAAIGSTGGALIVDNNGEDIIGTGGLNVPSGVVEPGEVVVFHMRRYHGPQACLPFGEAGATLDGKPLPEGVNYIQYESCYVLRTEPEIKTFAQAVQIGMCLEPSAYYPENKQDQLIAVKGKEVERAPGDTIVDKTTLKTLEKVQSYNDWMECVNLGEDEVGSVFDADNSRLDRLASRAGQLLSPIGRFLSPRPAHAKRRTKGPFTVLAEEFSRVGPVRPVVVTYENVDQVGLAGQVLEPRPTVIVKSHITGTGVSDVPVSFAASGTSSVDTPEFTDPSGYARAAWTLGSPGNYSLDAKVWYYGSPVGGFPNYTTPLATKTFTAIASEYKAYFMSPLGDGTSASGNLTGITTRVFVCGPLANVGALCNSTGSTQLKLDDPKLDKSNEFWQTAWKPAKSTADGLYRIEVRLSSGARIGYHYGRRGGGGGTDENGIRQFNSDSNIPVKYQIWK
jgi:hypothetical protein